MLFYIATQPPAEAVPVTPNQSQSIGSRFSSDQLYEKLLGPSPTPNSYLTLSLELPPDVDFGFIPPENGSLQWLDPRVAQPAWSDVVTTGLGTPTTPTRIPIGIGKDVDLRFIPTAEAFQLASDSQPFTVAR